MIPSSLRIIIPLSLFTLFLFLHLSLSKPSSYPFTMPARRDLSSSSSSSLPAAMVPQNKKLRRLPHVFSKVLELPFDSDADVSIEDLPDCIRFFADGGSFSGQVRTHVVEVHPGVTKVTVRRRESRGAVVIDDLELNLWRFRLPAASRPEMATAGFSGGRLVVIVPKNSWRENISCVEDCKGGGGGESFRGNMGNVILVE